MAAATDLEKIAKLADAMESIVDLVRQYGFLVNPRPRMKRAASNGVAEDGTPKRRRGRPRKIKPAETLTPVVETDTELELE